jgi:pentatricopeptide repeat protein
MKPSMPVATELDSLLQDPSKDANDAWKFVLDNFSPKSPALQRPALQDRILLQKGAVFNRLLEKVVVAWCKDQILDEVAEQDRILPSPSQVINKLRTLKVLHSWFHMDAIWVLLVEMIKQDFGEGMNEYLSPLGHEILKLWADLLNDGTMPSQTSNNVSNSSSIDWGSLKNVSWKNLRQPDRTIGIRFEQRLRRSTPGFPTEKITALSAAAVATFEQFTRRLSMGSFDDVQNEAEPFLWYMVSILYNADVQPAMQQYIHKLEAAEIDGSTVQKAVDRIRNFPLQAKIAYTSNSLSPFNSTQFSSVSRESLENYFTSRLGKALEAANLQEVERLWNHAQQVYTQISDQEKGAALSLADTEEDANPGALPSRLYTMFLHTLSGLGRLESATKVWNYMIQHGTKPSIAHWNSILQCYGKKKDADGLEALWKRMIEAGTIPDLQTWTTRVHGMALSGRLNRALFLLEEMSETWDRAERANKSKQRNHLDSDRILNFPQPATEVLNAAVTVFARRKRRDLIQRAFAWAHSQGIKPDHITFNALIRLALREQNLEEAMKLLQHMAKQNIQPDEATFAITLDAALRSAYVQNMSPEQQGDMAVSTLTSMETQGLLTSRHIFATLIDRLLKTYNNTKAAYTVLKYMRNRNVTISPPIYTSLMTHYFNQEEPDFAAIEALWSNIRSSGSSVDHLFYDRMIEMYSRAGDTGNARRFLNRMSNEGKKPSYQALMELLQALAKARQWSQVQELIRDIKRQDGLVKSGIKYSPFARRFWEFVDNLALPSQMGESALTGSQVSSATIEEAARSGCSVFAATD